MITLNGESNSRWILNQNICDLLVKIQKDGCGCILKALDTIKHAAERCAVYDGDCDKCIRTWINEQRK